MKKIFLICCLTLFSIPAFSQNECSGSGTGDQPLTPFNIQDSNGVVHQSACAHPADGSIWFYRGITLPGTSQLLAGIQTFTIRSTSGATAIFRNLDGLSCCNNNDIGIIMSSASGFTFALAPGTVRLWQFRGNGILSSAGTTVALLPAVAGQSGGFVVVTDSTAVATEGQTCVGSSSNVALAFSNGSVWKCF